MPRGYFKLCPRVWDTNPTDLVQVPVRGEMQSQGEAIKPGMELKIVSFNSAQNVVIFLYEMPKADVFRGKYYFTIMKPRNLVVQLIASAQSCLQGLCHAIC